MKIHPKIHFNLIILFIFEQIMFDFFYLMILFLLKKIFIKLF